MKLHDLKPAPGSRRARTRVGRGIAAGQGKTAGRGTKGQKARAGGTIPAWFEGGQTPIHVRVPKLRGFSNARFRTEYQVVNVGQISAYAEAGRFGVELEQGKPAGRSKSTDAPVTVNAEVLAQAGLIRGDDKPLKVLGQGEVSQKLFVAADAFSASARKKIEDAGGFVQLLREPEPVEHKPAAEAKQATKGRAATSEAARADESTPAEETEAVAAPVEETTAAETATEEVETATEDDAPATETASESEPAPERESEETAASAGAAESEESEPSKPARKRTARKDAEES